MSADCLFCKIVAGSIPTSKVFENENVIAFKDLHPQAPMHYLFIHKRHTRDLNDMMDSDPTQAQDLFSAMNAFSKAEGLTKEGFRVVNNIGRHAGQTIFHTHFHLLAGGHLGHFGH